MVPKDENWKTRVQVQMLSENSSRSVPPSHMKVSELGSSWSTLPCRSNSYHGFFVSSSNPTSSYPGILMTVRCISQICYFQPNFPALTILAKICCTTLSAFTILVVPTVQTDMQLCAHTIHQLNNTAEHLPTPIGTAANSSYKMDKLWFYARSHREKRPKHSRFRQRKKKHPPPTHTHRNKILCPSSKFNASFAHIWEQIP